MAKKKLVSVKATMQADGALLIEVLTDAYKTSQAFVDDGGAYASLQMINEAIRVGHITDLRVIEFFRTPVSGKNIDYKLMRNDGTAIPARLKGAIPWPVQG